MKTLSIGVILGILSVAALAEGSDDSAGWQGGPGGFGDESGGQQQRRGPAGGPGHGHGRPPGLAGPDAMKACVSAAGVTVTEGQRPELTDEQKSSVKSCLDAKESAMKSCLSAAGITMPEPPQPGQRPPAGQKPPEMDSATKAAIDQCRTQVASGSASTSSTDSATSTDTEVSATVINSAI